MKSWKYAERTKMLNPIDDEFFRKMAEDEDFCQEVLQVILQDERRCHLIHTLFHIRPPLPYRTGQIQYALISLRKR